MPNNVGTANTFRQLGTRIGITVFFVDAGKDSPAILIAQAANLPQVAVMLARAAAVIGHNWPVFIGFRGRRGESTAIGVLLTVLTQPMPLLAGPAVLVLLIRRNVTLASTFLFIPLPIVCWWLGFPGVLVTYSIGLPCLVGFTHYLRARQVADTLGTGST
ncbi:glycerol-3-phosphate acyltransferase [Chloroflexota bacterium]